MPLIKKLCIKCWNKGHMVLSGDELGWTDWDEGNWKNGYITCPTEYKDKGKNTKRKITKEPPTNCPFILEHVLTSQKRKTKHAQ